MSDRNIGSLGKRFGDLRIRPKLMVLHNLFFLGLTVSVYFSLIPLVEGKLQEARVWTAQHPGAIWHNEGIVEAARIAVFSVLAGAYILAVLLLELLILPRYVYAPIRIVLKADEAARQGDRAGEIIDDRLIPGDEIGQIMASRNSTVRDLRKREEDLEQAKRNLESQDRLVSLGMLSASVAHEMNTPLAVLHGSIEKMLETTRDEATRQRLERMIRVTQRLRRISEGLLGFARVRRQTHQAVDLQPLVEEAWHLVGIDEKAGNVAFHNGLMPEARVTGNADQLVQVFLNLLRNALHAVERGGEVRVEQRATTIDGHPALAVLVQDNGPGIPQELIEAMFDAFVSTRLDARGTGLGLTVAEGIVNQHGGTLTASNRRGGGACLEVRLPCPREETP